MWPSKAERLKNAIKSLFNLPSMAHLSLSLSHTHTLSLSHSLTHSFSLSLSLSLSLTHSLSNPLSVFLLESGKREVIRKTMSHMHKTLFLSLADGNRQAQTLLNAGNSYHTLVDTFSCWNILPTHQCDHHIL